MKTIGLIGGTGWASSAEYYRLINQKVNKRLGGQEYAECILYSMNFGYFQRLKNEQGKSAALGYLTNIARNLILSGADGLALCANTMHLYADKLQQHLTVPLIHIGEATAKQIKNQGLSTVGLLGTKITMESVFYKDKLKSHHIETLVPEAEERDYIQSVIFNELFHLTLKAESRKKFLEIINHLKNNGAQGIVLGCTEIPLLISQEHTSVPLFDTLEIHTDAIVQFILNDTDG